jgi:dimethylglycine catabolism A
VVIVTTRATTDVPLVTCQGTLRRLAEQRLEIVDIYNADVRVIDDLAMLTYATLTYATLRAPDDTLTMPLRAAGIPVIPVGDARAPQEMLFATASGHAAV